MKISEIEHKICCDEMSASQVFTQMKQHIQAPSEEVERLSRKISKRNKVINYCISQIHDSSKLKYIGTLTRDIDE